MEPLHRATDAVITICQDNTAKNVIVTALSEPAKELSGLSPDKIVGESLAEILPDKIVEMVNDYLEYEDGGNDIEQVLSKIRNFSLRMPDGKNVPCKLKVVRTQADAHKSWFNLILQDDVAMRKAESVRAILRENFKGHEVLDPVTGLPDRGSMQRDLELVQYHADNKQLSACFALMGVDNYQALLTRHGRANCDKILTQVAMQCRRNLRGDDVVGLIGADRLGIILLDISNESARIVLNRLRWLVSSHAMEIEAGKSINATVSVSFASISSTEAEEVIRQCETSLEVLAGKQLNTLVEAV